MGGGKLSQQETLQNRDIPIQSGDNIQNTLLALFLNYPDARAEIMRVGLETIFTDDYLELATLLLGSLADSDSSTRLSQLADSIEKPVQKMLFSRIMVSDRYIADIEWRSVLDQCTRSNEKKQVSSIKDIAARLAVVVPGSEEYILLLQQADNLRARKSKL
jgi:hypothetical protein